MKKYKVVKGRVSEFENPIKVSEGENVLIKETSNPDGEWAGWVYCETKNNAGWIPDSIINAKADLGFINEDYNAFELDLVEGEILIRADAKNGWIWCYKDDEPETFGWAPLNHIVKL
jgi:hypothetical protein